VKFLIDTQLPPILADFLSARGFDSIHTTHFVDGHLLTDKEIIRIAKEQERVVVTKDSDFSEHFMFHGAPPKVLLIEFGNISNQELLKLFDNYFKEVLNAFNEESELVVFRKEEIIGY
jgi:predicted nuclease of predicted toxin-antitoxin system